MKFGKAKYGFLLNEQGFPNDDVIVYRDKDVVHIVINAGNRDRDDAWVRERCAAGKFKATVENVSDEQAMIAIQGRDSEATMQPLCERRPLAGPLLRVRERQGLRRRTR